MAKNAAPLKKLQIIINDTYFKDEWEKDYAFCGNAQESDDALILYQAEVLNFSKILIEYLTVSIVNGNYLSYVHQKFLDGENVLVQLLKSVTSKAEKISLDCENDELKYKIQDYFYINCVSPFKDAIEKYQRFILDLYLYYDDYESIKFFQANKRSKELERTDKILINYLGLFNIALSVAHKDHFLKFNNSSYSNLLLLKEDLNSNSSSEILIEAVDQKINFLMLKLLNRDSLVGQKAGIKYVYAFGLKNYSLELEEFSQSELYKTFIERMNSHYELIPNFRKIQQKNYNSTPERLQKLIDFHTTIKVYKDINQSEDQIRNLYEDFKIFINSSALNKRLPFDRHALNISHNYFFNNYISILVSASRTFDYYQSLLKEVEILQNKTLIKNYFAYYKICEAMTDYFKTKIRDEEVLVENLQMQIGFLDKAIIELENNFHWSSKRNLYVFQLTRDESYCTSTIAYDGEQYSLFSANSFVLPLPYREIGLKIADIKNKFNNVKNLLEFRIGTEKLNINIRDGLDELKRSERKSTEILAIFSAVSLFAIGDIQILTSEMKQDPLNPFRFILAFGFGLSLFVFLIWIITRDNIRKVSMIQWLGFAIFLISSLFILNYFFESFSYWPSKVKK